MEENIKHIKDNRQVENDHLCWAARENITISFLNARNGFSGE